MELFDSHAHYNDERFNQDLDEIIPKIQSEGITKIVVSGYNLESSKKAQQISKKYKNIYTIVGISPNDLPLKNIEKQLNEIKELTKYNKNVAIGEIGLDYYWNKENKLKQQEIFIKQIEIANKLNLPIVIHTREATIDTIQILKQTPAKQKGIIHCCPLNQELVKNALDLGYYISFAGPITFKNSKNADEIIKIVPLEKILIETDCPYLAPEPVRGTKNDSRNLKYIAQKIAEVKGISVEQVAKNTYNNTIKVFKINQ